MEEDIKCIFVATMYVQRKPVMHIFEFTATELVMAPIRMFELDAAGDRNVKMIKTMGIEEKFNILYMRLLRTVNSKKVVVDYDERNYFYLPNHFSDLFKTKQEICEILQNKFIIIFQGVDSTDNKI